MDEIGSNWKIFSHTYQTPPALAPNGKPWHTWLMIGGRGAGKTRAGAEWVRAQALGLPPFATEKAARIALVGETEHDVREVMIEGVSGLLAVHGWHERPGVAAVAKTAGMERRPGRAGVFRGRSREPARAAIFLRVVGRDGEVALRGAAFDMLQFGLRLGSQPRQLITTTPRPTALLKRLIEDPTSVVTRAATRANANNLAPTFLRTVMGRYAGTRHRAAGARGRDHRGPARCAVVARAAGKMPRRRGAAAAAHRGRGRSAGIVRASAPTPAASSPPASPRAASVT